MENRRSTGQNKLSGYFEDLLKNKIFISEISRLREIYFSDDFRQNESKRCMYWDKVYELCAKFNLSPHPWREVIVGIISEGEKFKFNPKDPRFDMCTIRAFVIEENANPEDIAEYNKHYPVAVCINPYATIEDIKDFVNKNKELIRSLLEHHQLSKNLIKGYKKRNSKVVERNDFIFENRKKHKKTLITMVANKFDIVLGYDDINKIIKREERKRSMGQ